MLAELRQWPQWVVHGPDKIPLRVVDGKRASSDNPNDWVTFDAAYALVTQFPQYGLGFVLTPNDPFTCVDLDDPRKDSKLTEEQIAKIYSNHTQIYNAFDTYAELSPSGKGCHIWCTGNVEARKFSEGKIEVYSTGRYMTVTFKPLRNIAVAGCQSWLNELVASIDKVKPRKQESNTTINLPEVLTDEQIYKNCLQASYGAKFSDLWNGNWQAHAEGDKSQSESDLALCNYLAHWTDNQQQVGRMFRLSALGKRDKAKRNAYLYHKSWGIVTKAFDLKVSPEVRQQFQNLKIESMKQLEAIPSETIKPNYDETINWQRPTGLLGDIAQFIYQAAIYPSHEVALSAAIAFMAGITGRAYNTVTNTGLNQYIVLLAGTAQGKEGAARGIAKLVKAVRPIAPPIVNFIGPSEIASAQGLLKYLSKEPCFMSHKGEIGFYLQKLNSKWAKSNETNLKAMLLDLFNKSGHDDVLHGSIYSDQSKNAPSINSPSMTLLGDSTPEEFYKAIDESNISEGLVSRFTVLSCPMVRPKFNDGASGLQVPPELIQKLADLVTKVCQIQSINNVHVVKEDATANAFQVAYREECLTRVWANKDDSAAKIWHRAHVRLLKLGALIAVGNNPEYPVITEQDYQWAAKLIDVGVKAIVNRFESGEIGIQENGWNEQLKLTGAVFNRYLKGDLKLQRANDKMIAEHAMTFADIQQTTASYACFRNDRNPAFALNNVIKFMIDAGVLVEASEMQRMEWGKRGKCYLIVQAYGFSV